MHPAHRRRPIPTGLEPFQQIRQVRLQVRLVVRRRHPVHPRRTTACAPLRSPRAGRTPRGPGPFLARRPRRVSCDGEDETSQVPGRPLHTCPALRPRRCAGPRPFGTGVGVFRSTDSVDSARIYFRGSITRPARSLCTLRSRGHPRTTQHSVPAGGQPWPVRTLTCWVA